MATSACNIDSFPPENDPSRVSDPADAASSPDDGGSSGKRRTAAGWTLGSSPRVTAEGARDGDPADRHPGDLGARDGDPGDRDSGDGNAGDLGAGDGDREEEAAAGALPGETLPVEALTIPALRRETGRRLSALRRERRFSQEELGWRAGHHRTHISQIERGSCNPTLATLYRIALALDVPLSAFCPGGGNGGASPSGETAAGC